MRLIARLSVLAAVAALAVLAAPRQTAAADCPAISFLTFEDWVYRAYFVPAGVDLPVGDALGDGVADVPGGDDNCQRERLDTEVRAFAGIDPAIAVGAAERPRLAFVLGNKCVGFTGPAFWSCLKEPLALDGRTYVGAAYPRFPSPQKTLPLGEPLGEATVGGEAVTVVGIDGVDPSVAVGVQGRPTQAYVATGVCPYERFDNRVALDDLRRCLTSPVWLVFVPPGARPDDTVEARADRPLPPGTSIAVSLALAVEDVGDVVPPDRSGEFAVGALAPGEAPVLTFDVPQAGAGRYEAVATCEACAATHGGKTVFPAGLFIIGNKESSTTTYVALALGVAFVALLAAALYLRRRRGTAGSPPRMLGPSS